MKDYASKATATSAICQACGHSDGEAASSPAIMIRQGHVRRASLAADGVCTAARGTQGVEHGVILMTAILLVERLANTYKCDPRQILSQMARCFDIKDRYKRTPRHEN